MVAVIIVDTSIFLNLLNVPGFNQDRDAVVEQFKGFVDTSSSFLLPVGAIFETGNHIVKLPDGGNRRRYAEIFSEQVSQALKETAPWVVIPSPDAARLGAYLQDFPDVAMRGVSLVDFSIVRAWEEARERHQEQRVLIWSLDGHLEGYDYDP